MGAGSGYRNSGARRGIGSIREHWGLFRGVGVWGLLGASGVYEGLAGSVGTQGPEGV